MQDRVKTILIVDDAPGVRLMLRAYLKPEGYDLLEADCAETALQLIKTQRIDLIMLDMMLPGKVMGNDILVHVRRRRNAANIPIIVMSSLSAFEDGLLTLDTGSVFLQKPFRKEALMPLVKEMLDRNSERLRTTSRATPLQTAANFVTQ